MGVMQQVKWSAVPPPVLLRIAIGIGLILLGVQLSRLALATFTPAGPLGHPVSSGSAAAAEKIALRFDPFFRAEATQAGAAMVTGLPLKLYGTRQDFATGRGSAIIATPDGVQSSFAVGDAVMPGARLVVVAGDHVEIERSGARERLYLDQSVPAEPAAPAPEVKP